VNFRVDRMRLIDTHAHLSDLEDRDTIVHNARQVGVVAVVAMGANLATSKSTLTWAEDYPGFVYPCIGIHPTEFMEEEVQSTLSYLQEHIATIVAVGEIGLDYWHREVRKSEDVRERQRELYAYQLRIAREFGKPASVHGRGAWRDVLDLAVEHGPEKVVFHWYSGPADVLDELLDRGYYISATPAAEYSRDHRAALNIVPLERIVIETDSPVFLRNRGRTSEPADLVVTLKALAKLKEASEEEVALITTGNAEKIFRI
jgi:TatD DNase family protein